MRAPSVIPGLVWETGKRTAPLIFVLLLLLTACKRSQQPTYAVVPKGQAHIFWQTVHAGAVAAAREANVEVAWNGPATEADFARQIAIVDDFINRHVDGILLAPTDRDALAPARREFLFPFSIRAPTLRTTSPLSPQTTTGAG